MKSNGKFENNMLTLKASSNEASEILGGFLTVKRTRLSVRDVSVSVACCSTQKLEQEASVNTVN
jgi:hypothetical protein